VLIKSKVKEFLPCINGKPVCVDVTGLPLTNNFTLSLVNTAAHNTMFRNNSIFLRRESLPVAISEPEQMAATKMLRTVYTNGIAVIVSSRSFLFKTIRPKRFSVLLNLPTAPRKQQATAGSVHRVSAHGYQIHQS